MQPDQADIDFIAMMTGEIEESIDQQINLATEQKNEQVSWDEFRGNFQ